MGGGDNLRSAQELRPPLGSLWPLFSLELFKSPVLSARARMCLIEALLTSVGSATEQPKTFFLCSARTGHCQHFLHSALSEGPIICRCRIRVQWPVNNTVINLHCFLFKASRSLDRFPSFGNMQGPYLVHISGPREFLIPT
jgi:hypothetical protein